MNKISITFGRFNPIHKGNERLFEEMKKYSDKGYIFTSMSHDNIRNPLTEEEKRYFLSKNPQGFKVESYRSIIEALEKRIKGKNYEVHFITDNEGRGNFRKLVEDYCKKNHINLHINSIVRDEKSATAMREYALNEDIRSFISDAPTFLTLADKVKLFKTTQKGLE